ncbi:MAG: hypothetical protein K2N28_10460 [Muribaculaceae bacterium]|nr:hypothetical protein [Muribaculaceae bacterium]
MNILIMIVLGLLAVSAAGLSLVIHHNTMIQWWIPTLICILPAVPVGYALRRPLSHVLPTRRLWVSAATGIALTYALLTGAFYTLNYYVADSHTSRQFKVAITNKTTREHYRVRRIGRNRVGRGEKYYTHSVTVRWPDNRTKELPVTANEYARLRTGDSISLTTQDGLFGIPVIKNKKYTFKHKKH